MGCFDRWMWRFWDRGLKYGDVFWEVIKKHGGSGDQW